MSTDADASRASWSPWVVLGLVSLIGVPAFQLDGSELTGGEAWYLRAVVGPMDQDLRAVPDPDPWAAASGFLRGWSTVVGTTEPTLRLAFALGLVLAALVTAEATARLLGSGVRTPVYLAFASSPFLARSDLVYPGLLAPLPAALVLGGLVFARGGSPWWLVGAILGTLASVATGPVVAWLAAGVAVGGALWVRPRHLGRATLLAATLGGAGFAAHAWGGGLTPWLLGNDAVAPHEPAWLGLTGVPSDLASMAGPLIVATLALFGAWKDAVARGTVVTGAVVAGLVTVQLPNGGAGVSALLPVLTLAAASGFAALPKTGRPVLLGLLVVVVGFRMAPQVERRLTGVRPERPVCAILDACRLSIESGGRLVVLGEQRHAALFYTRRGHHPGVPLVLVPDDVPLPSVVPFLKDRLQVTATRRRHPTVLVFPAPPDVPGGKLESRPKLPESVAALLLSPSR